MYICETNKHPIVRCFSHILTVKRNVFISYIIIFLCIYSYGLSNNAKIDFNQLYDSVNKDFHYRYFNNSDFSFNEDDRKLIESMLLIREVESNPVNYARVQYLYAMTYYSDTLPDFEKVISIVDSALKTLNKDEYPVEYARLILLKGMVYVDATNYYVEAYRLINEVLNLLDIRKDPEFIALAYNYLAILWIHLNEWENALDAISKSEKIFMNSGYEKTAFFVRSNSYSIYIRMGDYINTIVPIHEDLKLAKQQQDTTSAIFLNMLLGNSYASNAEFDSSYVYLSEALDLINNYEYSFTSRKSDVLYSLGRLLFIKKDYDQSLLYMEEALPYVKKMGLLAYESSIYQMMSEIYEEYGQTYSAYDYLKESVKIKDSLAIKEKAGEVQRIKNLSELKNYQQQIQITEQNAKIRQVRSVLIITALILILVIIIFILIYINREKKLKEFKIQQLDQQLKNEEINSRLEKMELEKEVEEKKREIATTQLLIEEKNKISDNLLETFKPFYKSKEISSKIWRELQSFATNQTRKENEWDKSKVHFEKVHPDFFKKLKDYCPDLTENDLRLCAYIKIGMRSKQIAEMLSIDHRSVISNRYHLKKKLNLDKEQSLDDFIRNI